MGKKDKKQKNAAPLKAVEDVAIEETIEDHPGTAESEPQVGELTVEYVEEPKEMWEFFNRLLDITQEKVEVPALEESCSCGGSIAIYAAIPEADRKTAYNAYKRKHKDCLAGADTE